MSNSPTLAIVAFEGFEELDAIGPYEVFQSAANRGAEWTVEMQALAETDRVTAAHGLRIEPDGVLDAADPPAYLLVPGGGWNAPDGGTPPERGARAVAADEDALDTIRAIHDSGATVASVCTGGMVLAATGLLDGRPASTHHHTLAELRETAADVREHRVVDDGDVLTAGGVTAGIDLALWLVEREWGADVADSVADALEHERSGDVFQSSG